MLRAPSCKPYFNNHKVNVHESTEALRAVHKGYPTFQLVSRFAKMGYEDIYRVDHSNFPIFWAHFGPTYLYPIFAPNFRPI